MAKYDAALEALRRLNQYKEGRTVQPGMFSTLDEAIKDAPFEVRTAKDWADYLQPGRMVKREGAEFPVKKDELVSTGLLDELGLHGGSGDLTKTELLEIVRQGRPTFGVDVGKEVYDVAGVGSKTVDDSAPEAWGEVFRHSEVDPNTGGIPDLDNIKVMEPKFGAKYGGEGRYHHTSPSSTYEESFTRLNGLVAPTHHTGDTLSWSRVTVHNTKHGEYDVHGNWETPTRRSGNRKVRLVEEIQADVHRKAASKVWYNPENRQHYTNEDSAKLSTDTPEIIEEVGRVGYRTDNTPLEIAALRSTSEDLDSQLKKLNPITPTGRSSQKYQRLTDEFNDTIKELERLEMKMHDAPHKKPQEYAQLELRKQLMNAVDDGDDYLALVRGRDQIERYKDIEDLSPKKQANMNRMYDEIYAGELKKLAKRYGATVEDIELQLNKHLDPEQLSVPEAINTSGWDSVDDMLEGIQTKWESNPINTVHDLDIMHEAMRDVNYTEGADQKGAAQLAKRIRAFKDKLEMEHRVGNDAWKEQMEEELFDISENFEGIVGSWNKATGMGGEPVAKSFPAIKITPEVRERILKIGVPQYQHGGLVRPDPYPGMEYIPKTEHLEQATEEELDRLRYINYQLSGGETGEEMNRIRELERMYNDPQYWKDVPRHALAAMKSMWKTLDPETGESTWNFGYAAPPFEMVERGIMSMDEWKEMKEVADRLQEEKPPRPGIIDETIAMRALMTEVANMFRDERVEPPEYAAEAMERSMELQEATEEQMGLDPAVGFPQRFGQMAGFMMGQIPSPKSLTEAAGKLLTRVAPSFTKRVPKVIKAGIGAPLEFMDPTIRPALSTYLTGAAAGTGLIYGIEAAAESRLEALEEAQVEAEAEQLEEEEPEEFARGGDVGKALKKLKELESGVIDAGDVFATRRAEIKQEDPKFQEWLEDFSAKIEEKSAAKSAQMAEMDFSYEPGDVVMGEKYRHEILFRTIDSRDGKPAYHVKNLDDGGEYMLPERGIVSKFEGPKDVEVMQELEAVRYEAVEEFDEIFEMIGDEPHGYDLDKLEITERIEGPGDKYRGRLGTPDGDLWFTYDLSELNPGKTFILDEIE